MALNRIIILWYLGDDIVWQVNVLYEKNAQAFEQLPGFYVIA